VVDNMKNSSHETHIHNAAYVPQFRILKYNVSLISHFDTICHYFDTI